MSIPVMKSDGGLDFYALKLVKDQMAERYKVAWMRTVATGLSPVMI
ncbi:MAG: hypothetical protein ACLT8H_05480 [Streptococcus parasanguinis]